MKKLVFSVFAALSVIAVADTTNVVKKAKLTPEEKAARRAKFMERQMKLYGGWVNNYRYQEGWIAVVNAQNTVNESVLEAAAKKIGGIVKVGIKVTAGDRVTLENADKVFAATKANLAVLVTEDPALPGLLFAPEQKWVIVNVAKYAGKNQDEWVRVEVMRALCFVSGAGMIPDRAATMAPVTRPEEIAYIDSERFSFETSMNMINNLRFYGVTQYERRTYKDACAEGWAPAPTNEYQKAIWNQVHDEKERGPTNALKIVPPKK